MKSRTQVARFAAATMQDANIPRDELVRMLAAWLKDTNSTRQSQYLIEDIAKMLAESGYVYATVTVAHPMSSSTQRAVVQYIESQFDSPISVELNQVIAPDIIGGVKIDTPIGSIDATVKRKLIQIIKGVQR